MTKAISRGGLKLFLAAYLSQTSRIITTSDVDPSVGSHPCVEAVDSAAKRETAVQHSFGTRAIYSYRSIASAAANALPQVVVNMISDLSIKAPSTFQ